MRAVNLLPKDDVQRRRQTQNVPALVAALAVLVFSGLLGVVYLMQSGKVKDRQAKLESVKAELALLPSPERERAPVVAQLAAQQQGRVAAVSSALQHRVAWDRVLREFALVVPEDVWLIELNGQSPTPHGSSPATPTPGIAPTQFVIKGYTYSHAAVARLLTRVAVIPDLRNVFLMRSTRKGNIVEFAISAEVRAPGATS